MAAAGKSSMRGWCSFHLPGVSLRGHSKGGTEQLLNGQPGSLAGGLGEVCTTGDERIPCESSVQLIFTRVHPHSFVCSDEETYRRRSDNW